MTSSLRVGVVAEGDGDVPAIRVLLDRLMADGTVTSFVRGTVLNAHGRGNLTRPGGVERFCDYLAAEHHAALVVLDADEDCALTLAQDLSRRLQLHGLRVPAAIVVSTHEFEAWFVADFETLAGLRVKGRVLIPSGSPAQSDPESIASPKGLISAGAPRGTAYKETSDQPALSSLVDLGRVANRSRSFRRLISAVNALVADAAQGNLTYTP